MPEAGFHDRSTRLIFYRKRRKPKFQLPPGATDAHCHVFGPGDVFPYAPNRRYTPDDAPKEDAARRCTTIWASTAR